MLRRIPCQWYLEFQEFVINTSLDESIHLRYLLTSVQYSYSIILILKALKGTSSNCKCRLLYRESMKHLLLWLIPELSRSPNALVYNTTCTTTGILQSRLNIMRMFTCALPVVHSKDGGDALDIILLPFFRYSHLKFESYPKLIYFVW